MIGIFGGFVGLFFVFESVKIGFGAWICVPLINFDKKSGNVFFNASVKKRVQVSKCSDISFATGVLYIYNIYNACRLLLYNQWLIVLQFCGLATNVSLDADKNQVTHDLSYFSVPATLTWHPPTSHPVARGRRVHPTQSSNSSFGKDASCYESLKLKDIKSDCRCTGVHGCTQCREKNI